MPGATYGIVFAHMISLVEERLLLVHVLEIASRVAMHFGAVWRWGNALVWAIYLIWRLGEDWRRSLAVLGHAIVEEVVGRLRHAMAVDILGLLSSVGVMLVIWGKLRGKLALELVDVERLGQIGELVSSRGGSMSVVPVNVEVQVEIVKVNELCAGKVVGGRVHVEVVCSSPRLRSRIVHVVVVVVVFSAGVARNDKIAVEDGRVGLGRFGTGGVRLSLHVPGVGRPAQAAQGRQLGEGGGDRGTVARRHSGSLLFLAREQQKRVYECRLERSTRRDRVGGPPREFDKNGGMFRPRMLTFGAGHDQQAGCKTWVRDLSLLCNAVGEARRRSSPPDGRVVVSAPCSIVLLGLGACPSQSLRNDSPWQSVKDADTHPHTRATISV